MERRLKGIIVAVLWLCLLFPLGAEAAGFGDFEGGLLKIEPPKKLWIYKKNSTTTRCAISIGSSEYVGISDARWVGPELAVYLVEKDGDTVIRLYSSTTTFKKVK